ncbi:MAG: GAF domain-containing sensor histidine kinase [Candidatus Omnitrophica bacterium]|nr:GAF domain-containing sensor histidine kinase [Candidatus Omnitrophota bacterium]
MQDQSDMLRRQLETLYTVNRFMSQIGDIKQLIISIMEESSKAVDAEAASVALCDPDTEELYFEVALGEKKEEIEKLRIKKGVGIIGQVAQTGIALNVPNAQAESQFDQSVDQKTHFTTRSILAVPIRRHEHIIGVLEVLNKKGQSASFSGEDQRLLEIVASQAAVAIENAHLLLGLTTKHGQLLRTHRQLLEAQDQLIQSERLSAVGKMASAIIHDFKTPMAAIRSFCEMLNRGMLDQGEINTFSEQIMKEIDRFVGMTRDLLEFVRGKSTVTIQRANVKTFLENIISFVSKDFETQAIRLVGQFEYAGECAFDEQKMSRVIFNLLGNARDAMQQGGSIFLSATKKDHAVTISVRDTGPGIPAEIRDSLFEAFVTHGKKHGTGLGLAIAKKIIEDHGGTITVKSPACEKGQHGTEFIITLPL